MSDVAVDLVREPEPGHHEWLLRLRATVATDIADGRRIDMILSDLTTAITERIDRSTVAIITLDDNDTPHIRASTAPPPINRLMHGIRRRSWFGSWSAAITRQSDVVVPEVGASSLYREHRALFVQHELLAARAAPLRGKHHLVAGAIVLYLADQRILDTHELDVFEEVTELVALAIRRDQTTREYLDRIRHDPLTGLENRDGLEDHLRTALNGTAPQGPAVGLLFVDIDDLTLVNDSLGHTVGDTVIATAASRIRDQLMRSDTVVRFGGDEFIVVLDRIHSVADARSVAERIRRAIGQPIEVADTSLTTTVSIGITLGRTGTPPLQLIDEGHAAVVRAKQEGRGGTAEHDRVLDTGAGDRLDREQQLRRALDAGEFCIFWQPKVDLPSGTIVGAEALVRWNDEEHGIVGPDQFIPTAERAGMIDELSDWVLCQAIREAVGFTAVQAGFSVAINLSATQLARPDMHKVIAAALADHDLPPENLIVELTESVLADQSVVERLHMLRGTGVRLAIDDFGTGYSSLAYVQQLPVGIVKVDRAFIDGLQSDGSGAPVLKAAVAMAHALGMTTTVEGVETAEQLAGLRALDVEWGQGYLFAEPGPQTTLLAQLAEGDTW
jgi:diguanylate cyclase (GGDEF)-like protein